MHDQNHIKFTEKLFYIFSIQIILTPLLTLLGIFLFTMLRSCRSANEFCLKLYLGNQKCRAKKQKQEKNLCLVNKHFQPCRGEDSHCCRCVAMRINSSVACVETVKWQQKILLTLSLFRERISLCMGRVA